MMLSELVDSTWPSLERQYQQGWTLRHTPGGGQRVNAATMRPGAQNPRIGFLEHWYKRRNETPLVMISPQDRQIDQELETRGYIVKDPVAWYRCPCEDIAAREGDTASLFSSDFSMAVHQRVWNTSGVGSARQQIMQRVRERAFLLARSDDAGAAGVAFVGIGQSSKNREAMVHAVAILPRFQQLGHGKRMMRFAAFWAAAHGATHLNVLCTIANAPGNMLYQSLNMVQKRGYHYRIAP